MTHINQQELYVAGERAAHYRRRLAIVDGAPDIAFLMEGISFVVGRERPTKDPAWWIIGMVMDRIADKERLVYFNSSTRAVKVQQPGDLDFDQRLFG